LPLATVVTPNLHEVQALTGRAVETLQQMKEVLPPRSEVLYDGLLALTDFNHVHGHRTTAHAEVGGAAGQVGMSTATGPQRTPKSMSFCRG
jgi:hypothetical protein